MILARRFARLLGLLAGLFILVAVTNWTLRSPEPREQFNSALAALKRSDLDSVARAAHALQRRPGFESHALLLRGAVLLRSGDREFALRLFSQLRPEGELREPTMVLTTECLYHLGRLNEAEVLARKMAAERPNNVDAHRWLGAIYYDLGANAMSIAELKRVAELLPDDFACHRLLGIMHLDFEEYSEAETHFREALKRSPPAEIRQELVEDLVKSLVSQRAYQDALDALRAAEPTPQVLALRAECLWSTDREDDAYELLAEARRQAPDSRSVLLLEARIHQNDGRADQAVGPLQRALELDRHDAEARYQLAQAYRQTGRVEKFEEAMARWKESMGLLERLTALSLEAIEKPNDAGIRWELARMCDALGKPKLAASWRRAAGAYGSKLRLAKTAADEQQRATSDSGHRP